MIARDGQPIPIARLVDLLDMRSENGASTSQATSELLLCVIVRVGQEQIGLIVDSLLGEQEVVLKPLGALLKRVRNIAATTILGTGEICLILNPQDLVKSMRRQRAPVALPKPSKEVEHKHVVLLAEDSITTRTQVKRILEGAGYQVITAVDGMDAITKLGTLDIDVVVTDIQMPNMDGLTLTAKIRQDKKHADLPIILVTALASDEDKKRGIEVGANAYITKSAFDQQGLLDTLARLV